MLRVDIHEFKCVNEKLAERLTRAGFDSAESILDSPAEEILNVQGVGAVKLKNLLKEAKEQINTRTKTVELEKKEAQEAALEDDADADSITETPVE